ncbi:MAG: glycosyltransferase family 39 protein [Bacteroidaceae bacterium]|nr:glycosyltransferase family 39 protein [Bacteroidaceae bacterium]
MAIGTVTAFISQMALLMFFAKDDGRRYSEGTLFFVVLAYSLMLGTLFMTISEYFSGDTFMFSKADAMLYYEGSMRAHEVGFFENVSNIMQRKAFEDWGSYTYDSLLMSIIPSKFFLNLSYMLTGAISSVLLFRIGRHYMPEQYAYVAAMAYGTSSFLITFHCTFLKESLFVFFVICAVYNLCRGLHKESNNAYPYALLFIFILFFFRPAVAALIILSFAVYIAIKQHGSAFSMFFYLIIAVGLIFSMKYMMDMADRYSGGYETKAEASGNAKAYSGGFNLFVNILGGFFGPFPTLFTKHETGPTTIIFYGSGLTYRLFFIFPFLGSIYLVVRNKVLELLPITIFILMEMLATGMVAASLELRKVMPHIPFAYIVSFYGLSQWQDAKVLQRIPNALIICVAVGILLLWNVVKAK